MQELHHSIFRTLFYDPQILLILSVYHQKTTLMKDEEYKADMLIYLDFVEKLQPQKCLVNMTELFYIADPNIQEWVSKEISPKVLCLKKTAFILSSDLFASVATQQMLEDIEDQFHIQFRYFENEQAAKEWLLK